MSIAVPIVHTPGPARNVKKTAVRDGILVHFDPPNQWSDGTTEDWNEEQVAYYIVDCLRTDAGHAGQIATYADGTPLTKHTLSTKVRFDNINDDGTVVPGRPFHVQVTPVGHGAATAATTTSTGSPAAGSGTTPLPPATSATVASDGVTPASSPVPTVIGGPTFLYIKWDPLTNPDPVTYEVHMSTTTGLTPSGGTKLADVTGTGFVAKKDAAGVNLVYGTTYYVKIIAKDVDGSAAASAQASGSMVPIASVDTGDIADNAVLFQKLTASNFDNLSPDPSFEMGIEWTFEPGWARSTSATYVHSGNYAARATASALLYWTGAQHCAPGDVFYAEAFYRGQSAVLSLRLQVFWYDKDGTSVGATAISTITNPADAANLKISGQVTAPSTATYFRVGMSIPTYTSGSVWVDDFYVRRVLVAAQILAGTITANEIAAGTITSALIAANTIVAGDIAAGTITADRLNITTLSAITADLGTITAGTITGATIKTSSGSTRWEMLSTSADFLTGYVSNAASGFVAVGSSSRPSALGGGTATHLWLGPSGTSGPRIRIFDSGIQLDGLGTSLGGVGVLIGGTNDRVGFFDASPVTQRTDPGNATTTNADLQSKLNSVLGILRAYGLI